MYSLLPLMLPSSEPEEEVEYTKNHSGPGDDLEFLNPMQNTALPFNKYAWLTTHNSHAIFGSPPEAGSPIITFFNQEDSVTAQLNVSFLTIKKKSQDRSCTIGVCFPKGEKNSV